MNLEIRQAVYDLMVEHRRVNTVSRLVLAQLVATPLAAWDAATQASLSPDLVLRQTAEKVLALLAANALVTKA